MAQKRGIRRLTRETIYAAFALAVESALITTAQIIDAVEGDDGTGFCLACGEEAMYCEPDAREYECESCGESTVYGAQELLLYLVA